MPCRRQPDAYSTECHDHMSDQTDPFARLRELSEPGTIMDPDLLARLLEALPDAVIVIDTDGLIRLVNSQCELFFGYPRADLFGQPLEMLMPPEVRAAHVEHRQKFFMEPRVRPMGVGITQVLHGRHRTGANMALEINISPIVTSQGVYAVAIVRKRR